MALYYLRNTSTNWNATSSWSSTPSPTYTGVTGTPVSTDDVIFEAASGNVTSNVAGGFTVRTLDCTRYSGTLTLTQPLSVNNGFTGSQTMSIAGANFFTINGSGNFRSNRVFFPSLQFRGGTNSNLLDDWRTTTLTISSQVSGATINGFTISCTNIDSQPSAGVVPSGTTRIVASSSWSHTSGTSYFRLPVDINSSGTFSFGSTVRYGGPTITVVSGTIAPPTTTTFHLYGSMSFVNFNPVFNIVNWNLGGVLTSNNNIRIGGYLALGSSGALHSFSLGTYSLLFTDANNNLTGSLYYNNTGQTLTLPNSLDVLNFDIGSTTLNCSLLPTGLTISVNQNLQQWGNATRLAGGADIKLVGTGTWSVGSVLGNGGTTFRNRGLIEFNTSGTRRISGTVYFDGGTLRYVAGNLVTTNSTIVMTTNTTIFDTPGMTFANITYAGGGGSHQLITRGDLYLTGSLLTSSIIGITSSNNTIYVAGSFQVTGSSNIYQTVIRMVGTGTLTISSFLTGYGATQGVVIDTDGVITLGGSYFAVHNFEWIKGYVDAFTNNNTMTKYANNIVTFSPGEILLNNLTLINGVHNFTSIVKAMTLSMGVTTTLTSINVNPIYLFRSLILTGSAPSFSGTSSIYLVGEVTIDNQATSTPSFSLPIIIDAESVTFQAGKTFSYSGNLTYNRGRVISRNATLRLGSTRLIGFNRCPLENVLVVPGATLTMDEFFTGRPDRFCNITTTTGASFFYVWFREEENNGGEKFAKFVNVRNVSVVRNIDAQPGRLIINNNESITSLTGTNFNLQGVYYYNNLPNGAPKGLLHGHFLSTPLTGNTPVDPSFVVPGR